MKIYDAIKNFLYDQKYFITLYQEGLHVFNYIEILKIKIDTIQIDMGIFILNIMGTNLYISKLSKEELLIKGSINKIEKVSK